MLQQTINQLLERLQHRVPAGRDYQKSELQQGITDLPVPLSHFLVRRIDQRLSTHLERLASDAWLDASHPAVSQQLDQLQQTIDQAARIPSDEWPDRVSEAAREVMTYLVDPVSELTDFVFREDGSLSVSDVQERMAFFAPYSYLHSVFNAYADRQNLQTIDRNRFQEVLRRIDRQMVADYGLEKWVGLFEPLYAVLAAAHESGQSTTVPVELLQRLASNKDFDALESALERSGQTRLTAGQLREIISSVLESPAAAPPQQEPPSTPESTEEPSSQEPQPRWKRFQKGSNQRSSGQSSRQTPPPRQSPDDQSPQKPQKQDAQKTGQPLWQQFQQSNISKTGNSNSSASRSPQPAQPNPEPSSADHSSSSTNGPASPEASRSRKTAFSSGSSGKASGSLEAVEREVIGPIPGDQRDRFVRELFSGSQEAYRSILTELQSVDSWKDASSLIAEEVFLPHQVNIYSEPAVTFTDLVEARFREETAL